MANWPCFAPALCGGRFKKSGKEAWVLVHVRAGQEVFRREVLESGFALVAEPELAELEENYIMIFQNPIASSLEEVSTQDLVTELKVRMSV